MSGPYGRVLLDGCEVSLFNACTGCPFFSAKLDKYDHVESEKCHFPPNREPEAHTSRFGIPAGCPLRKKDITVTWE